MYTINTVLVHSVPVNVAVPIKSSMRGAFPNLCKYKLHIGYCVHAQKC